MFIGNSLKRKVPKSEGTKVQVLCQLSFGHSVAYVICATNYRLQFLWEVKQKVFKKLPLLANPTHAKNNIEFFQKNEVIGAKYIFQFYLT